MKNTPHHPGQFLTTQKFFLLILTAIICLSLSGCLVWESEKITIVLDGADRGTISVRIGPIGSDSEDINRKRLDLADFIYGYLKNPALATPHIQNLKYELTVDDNMLFCNLMGEFSNLESVALITDMNISQTGIKYPHGDNEIVVDTDGEVVSSNGRVSTDASGKKHVTWPPFTAKAAFTVKRHKKESFLSPAYTPSMSLLDLYLNFVKDPAKFKQQYLKFRIETAEATMLEKDYRAAWLNWQTVLQTDPDNKTAKAQLDKLYFTPFLNLAEGIPFPEQDISKVYKLTTDDLSKRGFKELQMELAKMLSDPEYISRENDLQKLINLIDKKIAVKSEPADRYLAAKLEFINHHPHEAFRRFREAHSKHPADPYLFAGYAKTLLTSSPLDAEILLREVNHFFLTNKMEDHPELTFVKGVALFMTKKSDEAIQTFISLQPRLFPDQSVGEFLKRFE